MLLDRLDRLFHRAAALVPSTISSGILSTATPYSMLPSAALSITMASGADDEEVAEAAVEQQLGPGARVDAAEDDREGVLALRQLGAAVGALVRVGGLGRDIALVAGLEPRERLVGIGDRRLGGGGRGCG